MSFWEGFYKEAEDKKPGYFQRMRGVQRATRRSDKGLDKLLLHPELIGERMTKGTTHGFAGLGLGAASGGLTGAGLGALKGRDSAGQGALLGAILGGFVGGTAGNIAGQYKADKEFLGKRGITQRALGFDADFSPEAQKKYIDAYRKEKK